MKGQNIIPPPPHKSLIIGYMEKFQDPIILILILVFLFSTGTAVYEIRLGAGLHILLEPLGVLLALLLATGIGFLFEVKASREFDVLNTLNDFTPVKIQTLVNGIPQIQEIPKCDVEVGNLVKLESGDEVPADGILEEALELRVDESDFTGEPFVTKTTDPALFHPEATYPSHFLLRGSIILEGNALMRVTAIGADSEEGKGIRKLREGKAVKTPLNRQLDQLGKIISQASLVIAVLIVVGRILVYLVENNWSITPDIRTLEYLLHSILLAVTLIVVAVPEGLPMSVTLSLALSMRKMLKEKNLVRKLHACETMGAATVICTDKTGTLTQNRMTVVRHRFYTEDTDLIYRSIALNSTADLQCCEAGVKVIGNPTEGALLQWLQSQGADYRALRKEASIVERKPFSTRYKYMETTVRTADGTVSFYKGAPEVLLDMCKWPPSGLSRQEIQKELLSYQQRGYRTLAFAVDNVLIGIAGIADPLRSDVREAIHTCRERAHVRVIIVTGDAPLTSLEIGKEIGLIDDHALQISGPDFALLSDAEALSLVKNPDFKLIARARPEDKARLVTLLQQAGEVVAVTGDGTNDAAALSKAQVGLSMGNGTARAKEASDITILDNAFSSINKAIMFGRSLYLNIKRFIAFQMTVNVCACFIVLAGSFLGMESPLTVTQMLWVNLIMDTFAAMALSSLPADEKVLDARPRQPQSPIIDRKMLLYILCFGGLFTALLLVLWLRFPTLGLYEHSLFFTCFVALQFWNLFNVRYLHTDSSLLLDILRGKARQNFSMGFWMITGIILIGQVVIVTFGGEMFTVQPLPLSQWLTVFSLTSIIFLVPEIYRILKNRGTGGNGISAVGESV